MGLQEWNFGTQPEMEQIKLKLVLEKEAFQYMLIW